METMTSVTDAVRARTRADKDAQYADRKGDWMQTFTGRRFYPADPRAEDVHLIDIAQGLSNCCRYAGQCNRFYSVAEHSILVSRVVPEEYALQGLMHDAPEAFLGDVTRPLKRSLAAYSVFEDLLWAIIAKKFKLPFDLHASVKEADNSVLLAERAVLFERDAGNWSIKAPAVKVRVRCLTPPAARTAFLERYQELTT